VDHRVDVADCFGRWPGGICIGMTPDLYRLTAARAAWIVVSHASETSRAVALSPFATRSDQYAYISLSRSRCHDVRCGHRRSNLAEYGQIHALMVTRPHGISQPTLRYMDAQPR
jgi:hypothetical protein